MNILLVGSGGREHALAWKLAQSPRCGKLYCAPGNAGIEDQAECVPIKVSEIDKIVSFVKEKNVELVVVGPEAPLVDGLADALTAQGVKVFGPSAKAAQLEGSKGFMKDICAKCGIPSAKYGRFTTVEDAKKFIEETGAPIVVKTDGLAAGKGVLICQTVEEAVEGARGMIEGGMFGDAGREIVIEEFLEGEEISYFALADGKTILPIASAQDHKRVGDGDTGLNTGGMGAYSPAHFITPELERQIIEDLIEPTIAGMAKEGCAYTGVLFAGLMVKDGVAKLLEYNVRFGDPECQPLMMRLEGDLVEILDAAAQGKLDEVKDQVTWSDDVTLCVVMAANGYPGSYEKGSVIRGFEEANAVDGAYVFHAGTDRNENGEVISVGGRVLGVTAKAPTVAEAQKKAYEAVDKIDWPEGFCRRDIGWRAL